jgi:hypothetical protein
MYVYELGPIDIFGLMHSFKDIYKQARIDNAFESIPLEYSRELFDIPCRAELRDILVNSLMSLWERKTYWEGDVRGDNLYIGTVPNADEVCSNFFIALKQDNNGTSYIISEFPFIHLQEYEVNKLRNLNLTDAMVSKINKIINEFCE